MTAFTAEIANARIWSGFHFFVDPRRTEMGVRLRIRREKCDAYLPSRRLITTLSPGPYTGAPATLRLRKSSRFCRRSRPCCIANVSRATAANSKKFSSWLPTDCGCLVLGNSGAGRSHWGLGTNCRNRFNVASYLRARRTPVCDARAGPRGVRQHAGAGWRVGWVELHNSARAKPINARAYSSNCEHFVVRNHWLRQAGASICPGMRQAIESWRIDRRRLRS